MKELSLNILDIANNSVKAGATLLEITVIQQEGRMTVSVKDDGCGMSAEQVSRLSDPFYTTRTTRKVGLGIPFLKLAAEQAGGGVTVTSVPAGGDGPHGTTVTACFDMNNIDCTPLGDIVETVVTLIQGSPDMDLVFCHIVDDKQIRLDTRELRSVRWPLTRCWRG